MENPWPTGVPMSLWTYGDLRPDALAQVPMMGMKFAPGFLYAFVFGCIFIALFSWKRFLVKSDVKSVSRALVDLSPGDIGGQGALIRAYFIYAGAILLVYVSLTFFGRLILQSTQMIPVSGIDMDVDTLKFDSAQWPLMLAFAFAGLAEMLPPIRMAEGWLRNRAYRAVGIPVRLEQTMRNLIVALDAATNIGAPKDELSARLADHRAHWEKTLSAHSWVQNPRTQRPSRHAELLNLVAQIELLIHWAKAARGKWPGHEVSGTVRKLEQDYVGEASDLLDALHKRTSQSQPSLSVSHAAASADIYARRARFAKDMAEFSARAEALRCDLVGIIAIYLERDPDSPCENPSTEKYEEKGVVQIDAALHKLLVAADRPESSGVGPEAGLFLALLAVFAFYAGAAWRGLVEPIGTFVETSNIYGVLATALVETLRIAALTWLPLLAAFSLRQYLWDTGNWAGAARSQRRSGYAMQIFACMCLAGTVAVLALIAVGALRAFFVAPTSSYFFDLLVKGVPFLLYFPSQAVILLALVPMALLSADLRKNAAMRLWYGIGCAAGVILLSMWHVENWNPRFAAQCPGLQILASAECARRGDLAGHLVLGVLAFLAAGVLGELPERSRQSRPGWLPDRSIAAVLVTGLALSLAMPVVAQEAQPAATVPSQQAETPGVKQPGLPPTPTKPIEIVMAMRKDAPPFSYLIPGANSAEPAAWRGFLAKLCLDVFAGQDRFRVTLRPVDANDRFRGLNQRVASKDHTDMLCDAVTMRFSDPARSANTVFSPIVFASGVSYLDKIERKLSTGTLLGYVSNSTAGDVAFKTCEIDHFNAMFPTERKLLFQRCKLRYNAARVYKALDDASKPGGAAFEPILDSLNKLADAAWRLDRMGRDETVSMLDPDTNSLLDLVLGQRDPANASGDRKASLVRACVEEFAERGPFGEACRQIQTSLKDKSCDREVAGEQPNSDKSITARPWPDYHFCPRDTHEQLIEWFCAGPSDQRRIYLGDRELILDRLESWKPERGPCVVEQPGGAEFLSYEPYAFPISKYRPELVAFVQRRIYALFSQRAEMNARFSASFEGRRMSSTLAYLFLLNAVDDPATLSSAPSPLIWPWRNSKTSVDETTEAKP